MQSYNNLPQRKAAATPGIESKVSVPQGKAPGAESPSPVKAGGAGGSIKGFSGALINPKC